MFRVPGFIDGCTGTGVSQPQASESQPFNLTKGTEWVTQKKRSVEVIFSSLLDVRNVEFLAPVVSPVFLQKKCARRDTWEKRQVNSNDHTYISCASMVFLPCTENSWFRY